MTQTLRKRMTQWVVLIVVIFCSAYLSLVLYALLTANRQIFPYVAPGYQWGEPWIALVLESNERLALQYKPHDDPDAPLIIFHHGNGEDLSHLQDRFTQLNRLGYAVLAYDYPGYGLSTGVASEATAIAAAEAVRQYALTTLSVPDEKIIHYGRSLGGGPAVYLTARYPSGGLILEATFTSTFRVFIPIKLLPWDVFDNLKLIKQVQAPILFIHGTKDRTVPLWHSQKLYELAPEPKAALWIPDGDHNNLDDDFADLFEMALRDFHEEFFDLKKRKK